MGKSIIQSEALVKTMRGIIPVKNLKVGDKIQGYSKLPNFTLGLGTITCVCEEEELPCFYVLTSLLPQYIVTDSTVLLSVLGNKKVTERPVKLLTICMTNPRKPRINDVSSIYDTKPKLAYRIEWDGLDYIWNEGFLVYGTT